MDLGDLRANTLRINARKISLVVERTDGVAEAVERLVPNRQKPTDTEEGAVRLRT